MKAAVLARENLTFHTTMREYLHFRAGTTLRSLELGLLTVGFERFPEHQILVKNFEIAKYLPRAKALVSAWPLYHLRAIAGNIFRDLDVDRLEYLVVARLAVWLATFDLCVIRSITTALDHKLSHWRRKWMIGVTPLAHMPRMMPGGVKLQDLDVANHGSVVVESATEIIGAALGEILREASALL